MLRRFVTLFPLLALPCLAQVVIIDTRWPRLPAPQPQPVRADCRIRAVEVHADVRDQAAKVAISQVFQNPAPVPMEAQLIFPIPEGAAVSGLTLVVGGKEMPGRLIGREEARRIYEDIVRRRRDPALLEYLGRDLFQTSVFPVPPNGESTVQIRYSQLLKKDSGLIDFLLPLGTAKHSARAVENLSVTVAIAAAAPIRTVYSPTHQADIARPDATHAVLKLNLRDVARPDDLRLLYSTDASPVGLNVLSYRPDPHEDGYFVLLATPEARSEHAAHVAKTMVFLCDRSGSMSGEKIRQAKAALLFLVRQLEPGDTFNIVAYDSEVESFRPELQRVNPETLRAAEAWVEGINAGGGTNIDGALRTGLRMLNDSSRPNYVIFLTDGQPTSGETREERIVANAAQENHVRARTFAFGIGFDVNARLLDRLAREMRGQSAYVRPNENIEAPVSALYAKIGAPAMTDVAVDIQLDGGATSRVYPRQMPDLFRGDQLVLVGRYRQGGAARIRLTGMSGGKRQELAYRATFATTSADESNAFVARLWATRRIGEIIDELDLHGRNPELIEELVGLSQRYGILTPYTSFLADDSVNLSAVRENTARAGGSADAQLNLVSGASGVEQRTFKEQLRSAPMAAAVAQSPAISAQAAQTMQQVGQKTFFRKKGLWQDSAITPAQAAKAIHVVQFSREYFELAAAHGGAMAQYLAFREPVQVAFGGQVYQIDPDK